jgi:hypothetical protein
MIGAISSEDAQYAEELVTAICLEVGPGLPGTPQERARAGFIKKELAAHLGAENVAEEQFTLAPQAFLSRIPALAMLAAALLNAAAGRISALADRVTIPAGVVFSGLAAGLFVLEFYLGLEVIDPIFKHRQSVNVAGSLRKPGTDTVRRLLIVSGHHDSALENTWLRLFGYGFFFLSSTFLIGMVTLLVMNLTQLAGLVVGNAALVRAARLGWVWLAYPVVPAIIFGIFANRGRQGGGVVPGAVDNLSACACAVALCRFLVRNPDWIPEETEIRFITFGSEEAGLRGARRYVARHLDELKRLEARVLNIEMVAHPEITILRSDVNGTVRHAPGMVKSVAAAAERAGVPYKLAGASIGIGTDAACFSRAGLQATTVLPFKSPQQLVAFYHQKWDRPERLSRQALLNVLKLALEWVHSGGE